MIKYFLVVSRLFVICKWMYRWVSHHLLRCLYIFYCQWSVVNGQLSKVVCQYVYIYSTVGGQLSKVVCQYVCLYSTVGVICQWSVVKGSVSICLYIFYCRCQLSKVVCQHVYIYSTVGISRQWSVIIRGCQYVYI